MEIPRVARVARAARAAREARAARAARARLVEERPGYSPQWMGHGMACAYATVSEGFAKEKIAVTILLERDRILRRGRVMGSYRLSGPRGFHVERSPPRRVPRELNASTNTATELRR